MADAPVKPRLVIFDLDGTLGVLPVDWYGLKKKLEEYLRAQTGSSAPFTFWSGIRSLREKLSPAALQEAYRIIRRYEQKGAENFHPNEFAIGSLKAISARGGAVAICSNNMSSTIVTVLERLDIRSTVSFIIGMDVVSHSKPHPEGLSKIVQELNIPKEESIFVGDTDTDRNAATAAGIRFIAIDSAEFQQLA